MTAFDSSAFDSSFDVLIPSPLASAGLSDPNLQIDFFGVDLLFTTGDLQVTGAGDYATVDGLPALRQAIYIRLITSPGEYALYPTFGCGLREFVKKKATKSEQDRLRQRIIEQLSQEERVSKVDEVVLEVVSSGVKVRIRVTAVSQQSIQFASVFIG